MALVFIYSPSKLVSNQEQRIRARFSESHQLTSGYPPRRHRGSLGGSGCGIRRGPGTRRSGEGGFPPQPPKHPRAGDTEPELVRSTPAAEGGNAEAPQRGLGDYVSHKSTGQGEGRAGDWDNTGRALPGNAKFHAGSWGSWCCCCCLIPADRPWDRERGRRWRLEMADTRSVHETRFEAAVKVIQSLPKNGSFQPTNEMMLKFYSFYKQATEGPCKLSRPGFWDPIGRYKWDAWSSLGDMTKEEAMIAYVEEMKKILETMPMTEKVEELLHVIGPFYEIVEDKKCGRTSDLTSDLGNVLTSTPNAKTVNGKAESSDSGAESEEEEAQEEVKGAEQSDNDKKMMKKSANHKNLEIIVTNTYDKDHSAQEIQNDIHASSSLNGRSAEEIKAVDENLEKTGKTAICIHQDINDDHVEDVSGIQHLTSDSDSEVYCDSMEQFGQEESLDSFTLNNGPFRYYLGGDPNESLENSGFPEDGSPGNGNTGDMQVIAVEGKGEVKHGGEDGRSNSGAPHRERRGGENEFSNVRRGRGHRMQHLSEGSKGRQVGSGGDGERWGSDRGSWGSLNEQIALVLMRLQEDMQNVLQRLHKLETLTASQAKSSTLQTSNQPPSQRPSWWPFEMSPGALTFAIIWPFIAQWLVHLYYQRRRRKLN